MGDMIKMVVVLTVLSAFSGGLLAAVRDNTKDKIENQQLQFVKGPAIKSIFEGASNDPIADRFKIKDGEIERSFFVAILDGKPKAVAFESYGKGYGGDVGLMVGIDLENDSIIGVGVTTHAETPGLGAKAKDDPGFSAQFKGMSIMEPVKLNKDGGRINSISGATITSRAVTGAATDVSEIYKRLKPQLEENAKNFGK
ncbi:Ion-translocating oxidoreductase complex, subunit G [Desulfonema limicola]|uniref:Ion-translocating oxidoreductase complex subunit G n=1 Tax=Desulfonema limicola TaxID=45656 RepID=A0A975B7E0_9BACT|nr:RnfABCDGE type electron transport complex subunit G [Desulfonema limicola]QTA80072.1 Ion-translocating oxidoreductase complex, subunit G [Desulfonema limicola]